MIAVLVGVAGVVVAVQSLLVAERSTAIQERLATLEEQRDRAHLVIEDVWVVTVGIEGSGETRSQMLVNVQNNGAHATAMDRVITWGVRQDGSRVGLGTLVYDSDHMVFNFTKNHEVTSPWPRQPIASGEAHQFAALLPDVRGLVRVDVTVVPILGENATFHVMPRDGVAFETDFWYPEGTLEVEGKSIR